MSATMDAKRLQILEAAVPCFGRYGYARTSMDLLAKAAGMSRPALYQHFKSKEHLFQAMVECAFDVVDRRAAAASRSGGTLADRLYGVLAARLDLVAGPETEFRDEVLREAAAIAGPIVTSARERLVSAVEDVLTSAAPPRLGAELPARDVARLLVDALTGIELARGTVDELRGRLRQLVELTVRGLGAPA
ncbi:TetR/AcrR family transcriptional regulator [Nonomuraea jiangxiensis]|nr:TetR/AcrR family transcriptional regulator [Nonomuraea jiangxiensis]